MSLTRQKMGPANIPAKTAIHVNFAATTVAGYASAKNPVTVKNQQKINKEPKTFYLANGQTVEQSRRLFHSAGLALDHAFALDRLCQNVYRIFTINRKDETMK